VTCRAGPAFSTRTNAVKVSALRRREKSTSPTLGAASPTVKSCARPGRGGRGSASAASVNTSVVTSSPAARPSARLAAASQLAPPSVGCSAGSVRRNAAASPSRNATCGAALAVMSVTRLRASSASESVRSSASAASKRVLPSSRRACILAEASSRINSRPCGVDGAGTAGRAAATTSVARISSCSANSQ